MWFADVGLFGCPEPGAGEPAVTASQYPYRSPNESRPPPADVPSKSSCCAASSTSRCGSGNDCTVIAQVLDETRRVFGPSTENHFPSEFLYGAMPMRWSCGGILPLGEDEYAGFWLRAAIGDAEEREAEARARRSLHCVQDSGWTTDGGMPI